jgi:hypothetical protein
LGTEVDVRVPSKFVDGGGGATSWRVARSTRAQQNVVVFRGGVRSEKLRVLGLEVDVRVSGGLSGGFAFGGDTTPIEPRAHETLTFFRGGVWDRGVERVGEVRVPSGFCVRWWRDILARGVDRAAPRKRSCVSRRRWGRELGTIDMEVRVRSGFAFR